MSSSSASTVMALKDLRFRYAAQSPEILYIRNLEIARGESVFLFGPSGSGKTTLLELLAGVLSPTQGQLRLLDQELSALSGAVRDRLRADHIGYVFQSFNLIPYLNVFENIEMPLHFSTQRRQKVKDAKAEIERLCAGLGLSEYLSRSITELSVGQQQRVAVARALLGAPEVILADEPTSALDYDHREKFIQLLFEQTQKINSTVIFVSHDRSLQKLFSRHISLAEINEANR